MQIVDPSSITEVSEDENQRNHESDDLFQKKEQTQIRSRRRINKLAQKSGDWSYRYSLKWDRVVFVRVHDRLSGEIRSSDVTLERCHDLTYSPQDHEYDNEYPIRPVVLEQGA